MKIKMVVGAVALGGVALAGCSSAEQPAPEVTVTRTAEAVPAAPVEPEESKYDIAVQGTWDRDDSEGRATLCAAYEMFPEESREIYIENAATAASHADAVKLWESFESILIAECP